MNNEIELIRTIDHSFKDEKLSKKNNNNKYGLIL